MKKAVIALIAGALCAAALTGCAVSPAAPEASDESEVSVSEEISKDSADTKDAGSEENAASQKESSETAQDESKEAQDSSQGSEQESSEISFDSEDPHAEDKKLIFSAVEELGKDEDFMYAALFKQRQMVTDTLKELFEERDLDISISGRDMGFSLKFNDDCSDYDRFGFLVPELISNDPADGLAKQSADPEENKEIEQLLEEIRSVITGEHYYNESLSRRLLIVNDLMKYQYESSGKLYFTPNMTGVYGTFADGTAWGFSYDELEDMYMEEQQ